MDILRLETLHPMLVHLTVGMMPLLVVAFVVAWRRTSDAWAFVADVVLVATAGSAVLSSGSGLYLQFFVAWPGGLELWRYLHLGLGALITVWLLIFATVRLRRRKQQRAIVTGTGSTLAAAGVGVAIIATGWIGGEVLVFRSGMAVEAAGKGALALPVPRFSDEEPTRLVQVMHHLRGHWGQSMSTMARAIVEEPAHTDYDEIENAAEHMLRLATRLEENPSGHSGLGFMAGQFKNSAEVLRKAAKAEQPAETAAALGEVTRKCAACHQSFRWKESSER